jgi:signal peptidase II
MIKLLLALTLPLYLLDQATKVAVLNSLKLHEMVELIPGLFNLVRVHNTGIAFGQFNEGSGANIIFTLVAICALVGISIFWIKGHFPGKINGTAVALLISGILGNLTDRLWHGYVVDFLDFHIKQNHWPSFNVADSCICIAAVLLFIAAFRNQGEAENEHGGQTGKP